MALENSMRKVVLIVVGCIILLFTNCLNAKQDLVDDKSRALVVSEAAGLNVPFRFSLIGDAQISELGISNFDSFLQIAESLTIEERSSVEAITLYESAGYLSDFKGIELFPNLNKLAIRHSNISSFSNIENKKLTYISISYSNIKSLAGVEKLSGLESLGVMYCQLEDIGDIRELQNLKYLDLTGTLVGSIEGNKLPESVKYIALRETRIKSLTAISSIFGFVEQLDFTMGAIESIDDVEDFGSVKSIGLCMTPVAGKFKDKDGHTPAEILFRGVRLLFFDPIS